MNTITVNGKIAYSEDTAIDMLHSFGMDDSDIETLKMFLDQEEIEEAQYEAETWKQEYQAFEAYTENLQSVMNEVLNILDEALAKQRIAKARETMGQVRKIIGNAF